MMSELASVGFKNLTAFKELKSEIENDIGQINDILVKINRKITANINSVDNPNGLLIGEEDAYLCSININRLKLYDLFKTSQEHWNEVVEKVQR